MPNEPTTDTIDLAALAGERPEERRPVFPKRKKRNLRIDVEAVVESCEGRVESILDDAQRGEWMDKRLTRYRKYRGQLGDKTWPWEFASNVDPGILRTAEMRANAGLHNVVMTLRPLLSAGALSRSNVPREEKITRLVDYQIFLEPGPDIAERRVADFVSNGLQDGNAVAYTPWVRDERDIVSIAYRPPIAGDVAPADALEAIIKGDGPERPGLFPDVESSELDETRDNRFHVTYREQGKARTATVDVFEDEEDGGLTLEIRRTATLYDGPVMINIPIGSILVPTRAKNLQPPAEYNPGGAANVFILCHYSLDEIRRLHASGQFNYLDTDGLAAIEARAKQASGVVTAPKDEQRLEEQKDEMEGRRHSEPDDGNADEGDGHLQVPCVMAFDRWDVDGDGLQEDVYWLYARDTKEMLEARLLVEKWPATRPYRPLAEWSPIPVPDRWLGISLLELGEALYDLIKGTFDLSFDSAVVANLPFGFYSASSSLRQNTMRIEPGIMHPVSGDPRTAVYFPNMAARDQSWAFNVIGLASQFFEKLMMIGGVQLGQVPTGKASALRTFGTTAALIQQGDVRADQLLLRLFSGLRQVALNFHRMNRHMLPPGKEFRVVGWDGEREKGYIKIESVGELDAEIEFDFRPDFLLSNPQVLADTLASVLTIIASPLAFQFGIVDADKFYQLARDFVRAKRLDPKKYLRPPSETAENPVLAEEAIEMVAHGRMPDGAPMEGATPHLKKIRAFVQSDAFGHLSGEQVELLRGWMNIVGKRLQREQVVQQAAQFQQAMTQGGPPGAIGPGGKPTTMEEPGVQVPGQAGAGDPSMNGVEAPVA